jgi:hypothetical protein
LVRRAVASEVERATILAIPEEQVGISHGYQLKIVLIPRIRSLWVEEEGLAVVTVILTPEVREGLAVVRRAELAEMEAEFIPLKVEEEVLKHLEVLAIVAVPVCQAGVLVALAREGEERLPTILPMSQQGEVEEEVADTTVAQAAEQL